MHIFEQQAALRAYVAQIRGQGGRIGFVPTMGALHQGHASLVRRSKAENDVTICSIYVNPKQFNNPQDLATYPKTLAQDRKMLEELGCDALFAPDDAEMYPRGYAQVLTAMEFGELGAVMEGAHRPGHFNGVGIVVSKLFNLVQPHQAYFGQKDLQQYAIIRQMAEDLSFETAVIRCPIVREADGLAMSSRNVRLTAEERVIAPLLYQALQTTAAALQRGHTVEAARQQGIQWITAQPAFRLEYLEIADVRTLRPLTEWKPGHGAAICVAAHIGRVRLIDNEVLD